MMLETSASGSTRDWRETRREKQYEGESLVFILIRDWISIGMARFGASFETSVSKKNPGVSTDPGPKDPLRCP